MSDSHHRAAAQGRVDGQTVAPHAGFIQRIASEMQITTGKLLARFDFDRQWLTLAFRPWFDWHVDTCQISIAPGVIHFVEPTGHIVGIKVLQQAAEIRRGGAA